MSRAPRWSLVLSLGLALSATGCFESAPSGLRDTPPGPGALVRWDPSHLPLPEIPLPNDAATFADPTSRTGLRINASLLGGTAFEQNLREAFAELEGWGTFAPITVAFDADVEDPAYAELRGRMIDTGALQSRHRPDDWDFADDAVYLVDLETGVPVPLDVGGGNYPSILRDPGRYWPNDPRVSERTLLFETWDETKNGTITAASFLPEDDTDRDGVLDVPNLDDPLACPLPDVVCDDPKQNGWSSNECLAKRRVRDRCIADHLLTFYERETDTLVLRPLLPLDEAKRYAVVLTDRLVDGAGNPVRSPMPFVYPAPQEQAIARLRDAIDDPTRGAYWGEIAGTGLDHVAFAWSFTTQPTVSDLVTVRDGLYGEGPFAHVGQAFPPQLELVRSVGLVAKLEQGAADPPDWANSTTGQGANCPAQAGNLYRIRFDQVKDVMRTILTEGFGTGNGPDTEQLLASFDAVDSLLIGTFRSPYLLEGGPKSTDPYARWRLDYQTGEGPFTSDTVQVFVVVPKATPEHAQPFDVAIYGTGHTGNYVTEQFLYAGLLAKEGIASVGINPVGHGLYLDEQFNSLGEFLFASGCIAPFLDAIQLSRARDLDGDGIPDSGGDFWTAHLFHLRDMVRQSVVDQMQLVRLLRSFGSGTMRCKTDETGWDGTAAADCDLDRDGVPEVAGDFDADGVPDVGGEAARYFVWGQSLGGVVAPIQGAIDPSVSVSVPVSGGGGLTDMGVRSTQGSVVAPVFLRIMGPLVVTLPSSERTSCETDLRPDCTTCAAGEVSVRWVVPDVTDTAEIEIACLPASNVEDTTVYVANVTQGVTRCTSVGLDQRMRVSLPATVGDRVEIYFFDGAHGVLDYGTCLPATAGAELRASVTQWGVGPWGEGASAPGETDVCEAASCHLFQGAFIAEGNQLRAPADGLGYPRQSPAFRRLYGFGQAAVESADPVSYAPYYYRRPMPDVAGKALAPRASLALGTIGDMNVPISATITYGRALGAVPFLTPEQAERFPEYADWVTPAALHAAFGRTPSAEIVARRVTEGIANLARFPAGPGCAASKNAAFPDGTFETADGVVQACFPTGCASAGAACLPGSSCDPLLDRCVPAPLGEQACDEALFDVDDLDEGASQFFELSGQPPLRLARFSESATAGSPEVVWAPRLLGAPFAPDGAFVPSKPLVGLLDAYVVPGGTHTFVQGNPCHAFDVDTYLTRLVARFFASGGTDLHYLSHPSSHRCLASLASCP